ncbi:hypothetical protein EVAR_28788_1 [Eumeta japonica]|uniref:Uncharacterized protein n=1 Tax=Eumeta variegata TaxID=151549 RepID=A0A4C1VFB5_EUMVA|nr:hypothetical protein EVAR_28788_1 [Eumeta japonica]
MSHRTRESRRMPSLSHSTMIGLRARSTRELVHSLQMYCKLLRVFEDLQPRQDNAQPAAGDSSRFFEGRRNTSRRIRRVGREEVYQDIRHGREAQIQAQSSHLKYDTRSGPGIEIMMDTASSVDIEEVEIHAMSTQLILVYKCN